MLNLTGAKLTLIGADGADTQEVAAGKATAPEACSDSLLLRGERRNADELPMETATQKLPTRAQVDALNRLIAGEVDADRNNGSTIPLVLIPPNLLRYVAPALHAYVAAPAPTYDRATRREPHAQC